MRKSFLVFALILLVGCGFITSKKEATGDVSGPGGLSISVPKNTEVYVGQSLEIPVVIENTGIFDVENAMLVITGYEKENVKLGSTNKYEGINLEGRSAIIPVGEKTTEIFTIDSFIVPTTMEKKAINFYLMACYQYKTEASPVVCINPQLASQKTVTQGCNFVVAKVAETQGAPLAVSRVETIHYTSRNEVEHKIFVKDVLKTGVVLNPESYSKPCLSPNPLTEEDQNIVYLEAYMSGEKLRCYRPGLTEETSKFEIKNDEETLAASCFAKIDPNQQGFVTPLSVYLTYGYSSGKVYTVTVKNQNYVG